jgi:hypothetical protein
MQTYALTSMIRMRALAALPEFKKTIEDLIFDAYYADQYAGGRSHMGASGIGRPCEREVWLGFRHVITIRFKGRTLRLFKTGDFEEPRMVSDLRRIGCTVLDVDPDTGRQWQVRDQTGHFGGSMDGIVKGGPLPSPEWHLVEFKTHNAASFRKLQREGVEKSKPEHYDQMQSYMHLGDLPAALYMAKNKDNDDLYTEIVERNEKAGERILKKAKRLVEMPAPPDRPFSLVKGSPCNWCDFQGFCYDGQWPERNCRTCLHSTPVEDGKWTCSREGDPIEITPDTCCEGGKLHRYIPELVPGEQVDIEGINIVYELKTKERWVDSGV